MEKSKSRRMFGTDGVRDIANSGMMKPETAMKLGRAFTLFLLKRKAGKPKIAVGRDTRYSGKMIEYALSAGITSAGGDVYIIGEIPTPGVSYSVASGDFDGGAVISASHNPAEYNGIKFLDGEGFKLSDEEELEIEGFFDIQEETERPTHGNIGKICQAPNLTDEYLNFLLGIMDKVENKGYSIMVDAANGAASALVGPLFNNWKGRVAIFANEPDGMNINSGVGVTNMDFLREKTLAEKADIGIAYDGDTDRVLMCDEKGRIIDGDIMLWVIGRWLSKQGMLGSGVVATVMSNMALEDLLRKDGIKVFRCCVGDRYVLDTMRREKCRVGGEQSGHLIALDYANTGDGLCSGLLFLKAISDLEEDISTLSDRFDRYPQVLRNLKIENKERVLGNCRLKKAEDAVQKMLEGKGRMLLRPSGTEQLIRIFVESRDHDLMNAAADMLEKTILEIAFTGGC
ncbi:MAG: phosphoglucosamine mutase [Synergistaceae bacterium]|nr:phosphoglucosamine mutase [Synergistaceae bacterium]